VVGIFLLHARGPPRLRAEKSGRHQACAARCPEGADLCAGDPARAAQQLVDGGFAARYDYALQTVRDVAYDKWREYDPEDTLRYYALRLHELGFVKSTPQKIIADGTDWRYFNELKRELKA
jgi:NitT/TauT family transport system substrate-binding protein